MSALAREYRPALEFDYLNYFEGAPNPVVQNVKWESPNGIERGGVFSSFNVNLEASPLPVEDGRYDLVLFCEVLEHFTMDPLHALNEIWRVLKPGGTLILTTPNVARYENVVALIEGRNLYDPYSGYGPHGRHNREYSRHELHMLMRHAGFECETDFTSDVHENIGAHIDLSVVDTALAATTHREHDLGQYLFSRWRRSGDSNVKFPAWLYRSYPSDRFSV
jgi:SAM-dependent methyltransferase